MRLFRSLAFALIAVLFVSACTTASEPTTTTSSPVTTTTAPTTSTATLPETTVSVELTDSPAGLNDAVLGLYLYATDPSLDSEIDIPPGLIEHLADLDPTIGEVSVSGTVTTGEVLESQVAVVQAGEDIVLAVSDDGNWRIAGARLTRFGKTAWYGEEPRLVLIIGSDARPGQNPLGYRADSLHIAGIVPGAGEGAIVGIPRDSWVEASYGGNNKFTNVMASRGSVIPLFVQQIEAGQPLTVTDPEMTRFMMSIEGAVDLVLYAFEYGEPGELFVQKAPAATVGSLVLALKRVFGVDNPVRIIGTRHGEKRYETLLTREEMMRTEDLGGYYRVTADNRDLNYDAYFSEGMGPPKWLEDYNSDNAHRLSVDEMVETLLGLGYIREQLVAQRNEESLAI